MYHYRTSNVMGVGRGARIRRTVSNPGYQECRSSTPLSDRFQTPPILSLSPIPSRTPEGVYTQVQKGNKGEDSDHDSNNTDDLFNDSFDINDVEIPETTLTQEFPKCNVQPNQAQPDHPICDEQQSAKESEPKAEDPGKVIGYFSKGFYENSKKNEIVRRRDSIFFLLSTESILSWRNKSVQAVHDASG